LVLASEAFTPKVRRSKAIFRSRISVPSSVSSDSPTLKSYALKEWRWAPSARKRPPLPRSPTHGRSSRAPLKSIEHDSTNQISQELLRELGADETIDYTTQRFEDVARDVDIVLDPTGGDTQERSWQVLKKGGALLSIVQPPSAEKAKELGVTLRLLPVTQMGRNWPRLPT
jgi:Zinc-binding dehydrogenase